MNIISGWQRREYTPMGIRPRSDHDNRRYDDCGEYVTVMRELWDTGRSDSNGDFFRTDDCRCPSMPTSRNPIISAGQSDAGTRYAARYAAYNFCSSGGINQPTMVAPSVARMLDELSTVRGVRGLMLTFDDFVPGIEQFGTRIPPRMRCRDGYRMAA